MRRAPLAAAGVVLLLATDAFARAGGGGNFGGGGGGGSGGGGDGDGLFWLIWVCFRYPVIGIPLLLIVIVVLVLKAKAAKQGHQGRIVVRGRTAAAWNLHDDLAAKIRARDPAFDPSAFRARVGTAFVKVQTAWCRQDLTPLRPFVSDGVHERFSMQLEEQRALGYRDQMDQLTVDAATLVHADVVGGFDVVTVRIAATADDHRVSLATGKRESYEGGPSQFLEYWTFLRRGGARLNSREGGLMEGHCPNCGYVLDDNQFADCRSCHARLRSGEFDWVLVEITQGGEWAAPVHAALPGVEELAAVDPEFCVEAMEDRASVAFWRWATAMRVGDARALAGVATDEVVRDVAGSIVMHEGARRYVGECGVGSVDLLGVSRDATSQQAVVEVRWSGAEFEVRPNGPRRLDRTGVMSWLFVFERAAGARTSVGEGFASAHCRGCGAPALGASAVCAYCGAALADVNAGWTLARMTTRYTADGRLAIERLRVAPTQAPAAPHPPTLVPVGVLAWAARVMASDGVVDPRETQAFTALAARAGVSASRAHELLEEAHASQGEPDLPATAEEARDWLDFAVRAALADGVVTPAETALLMRLGATARLSAADVRVFVNRARAEMYQEAKAAIAHARRDG